MDKSVLTELAQRFGTPLYALDIDIFSRRCGTVAAALGCPLCYCMKADPFLISSLPGSVTQIEVCSPGELELCISHGISPDMLLVSGVVKDSGFINRALDYGVTKFTAESPAQLELLRSAHKPLSVLLRLTAGDQFGMSRESLEACLSKDTGSLSIDGLHYFSGTGKSKPSAVIKELDMLAAFAAELRQKYGIPIKKLEYGPGLFADYFGSEPEASESGLLRSVAPCIRAAAENFDITLELGRYLAAPCGAYLTTVKEIKNNGRLFALTDGGSHQLHYDGQVMGMRPLPVEALTFKSNSPTVYTLCGSLCSVGDCLAQNISLPELEPGSILAFYRAGGYCITEGMALFLCRDLPAVAVFGKGLSPRLLRPHLPTYNLCGVKEAEGLDLSGI